MTAFDSILSQVGEYLGQGWRNQAVVPVAAVGPAVIAGVGLLVAVLGAKLAKMGFVLAFAVSGAVIGAGIGGAMGVSGLVAGICTGAVAGVFGLVLHRLWVGVMMAVFLGSLAAGAYGVMPLVQYLRTYDQAAPRILTAARDVGDGAVNVGDIQVSQEFRQWADGVWQAVLADKPSLKRNAYLFASLAGVFGLLVGLVASRLSLIVVTSILGTSLLLSGVSALTYHFKPDVYRACMARTDAVGLACVTFLAASLFLQWMLTRSGESKRSGSEKS